MLRRKAAGGPAAGVPAAEGNAPFTGEYATVTLRPSWGKLSIATFLLAIPADAWTDWLPQPQNAWQRPLMPVLAILVLGLVGLVLALLGRRFDETTAAARFGLWLNAIAVGVVFLTIFGMYAIFALR